MFLRRSFSNSLSNNPQHNRRIQNKDYGTIQIMKAKPKTKAPSEAEQFVEFARKIVNVPKSEIDKQEAIWKRNRLKKKEARKIAADLDKLDKT